MSAPRVLVSNLPTRDDLWRYLVTVAPAGKKELRREFAVHGDKFIGLAGQSELEMVATVLDQATKELRVLAKICREAPPEDWKP